MLVDVVLYSGERELLDLRLDFLQADITVVIQGTKSLTGHNKPIFDLPKNVIGVTIENGHITNAWDNERGLRYEGAKKLHELDLPDGAIVGFFDVDEIPEPEIIRATNEITAWRMTKYQMSLSWYQQEELTGISAPWIKVKNENPANIRMYRTSYPAVNAGWHLSSFMTLEQLKTKWRNISHQELVRNDMDTWIENCWANGLAVENGNQLTEQPMDLPARFLELPDFMKRTRA